MCARPPRRRAPGRWRPDSGLAGWRAQARWHLTLHTLRGPGRLEDLIPRARDLCQGLDRAAEANYHGDVSQLRAEQGDAEAAFEELELGWTPT